MSPQWYLDRTSSPKNRENHDLLISLPMTAERKLQNVVFVSCDNAKGAEMWKLDLSQNIAFCQKFMHSVVVTVTHS